MKNKKPKQGFAFRNKYPAAFLALLFLIAGFNSQAQYQTIPLYGQSINHFKVTSVFLGPTGCGAPSGLTGIDSSQKQAAIYFDTCNHKFYVYDSKLAAWDSLHIGVGSSSGNNFANADLDFTGNRNHNAKEYLLNIDSAAGINFTSRISTGSENGVFTLEPDGATFGTSDATRSSFNYHTLDYIRLYYGKSGTTNNIYISEDSSSVYKRLSYASNLAPTFTKYSLVDKNYVDSVSGGGSSGLAVGTTTITGGSSDDDLYNNAGVLGSRGKLNPTAGANIAITGTYPNLTWAFNGVLPKANGGTNSTDYTTATETFTNKRWTARVGSTTSSATPTINTDNYDIYKLTAQAADITSFTTNLSGTPADGDVLEIQITGTATRVITWGSSFVASTVALPTATATTTTISVVFQYFTTSSYGNNKWVCVNYF